MNSLARIHFVRTSAALALPAAENQPHLPVYEHMLAQLRQVQIQLKSVQSLERKIERKRQIVGGFAPYVQGVLDSDSGHADEVLTTVMVWRLDTGDLAGALPLIDYALRHTLRLPERYKRSLATLVVEETAEQSLQALASGALPDIAALYRIQALTEAQDMPDVVRAKLHKALGLAHAQPVDGEDQSQHLRRLHAALQQLRRATALDARCGVKKEIQRCERALKKQQTTP